MQDDQVRPCNRERRGYINLAAVWTLELLESARESLSYFWPLSTHQPNVNKTERSRRPVSYLSTYYLPRYLGRFYNSRQA